MGDFTMDNSRGTSIIDIKIPLVEFIEPSFLFKYWDESPALSKQIKILDAGFATTHITDNNGQINLGKYPSGKQLSFILDQDRTESIVITQDNNVFFFILPLFTEVKIKVIEDATEDPIGNYFLKIKVQNIETEYQTGLDGKIVLNNIEAGSNIQISDENIKVEHKIQNSNNDLIFRVKEKSPDPIVVDDPKPSDKGNVTFTVYGLEGEKLNDYKLEILQEANRIETFKDDSDPSTRIVSKDRLIESFLSGGSCNREARKEQKLPM
ncbi:MAG: hypothetical protein IPH96_16260 [Saprospiraceae bacterium]|nr:hypothetical protein [Saprospiraceae bacterium]